MTGVICALLLIGSGPGAPSARGDGAVHRPGGAASSLQAFTAPSRKALLAVAQTAIIREYCVNEGECVRAGSVVALFEDGVQRARVEVARLKAESTLEVEVAATRLQHAQEAFERLSALGNTSVSAFELLTARATFETARLEHLLAKRNLDESRRDHALQVCALEELRLITPFDGVISERHKEAGETAESREAVATLVQLDPLLIAVDCPIGLAYDVHTDQQFTISATDSRYGKREGRVFFVSPVADAASQTRKIKLHLPNADGGWIAGMKVAVDFDSPVPAEAAAAP